MRFRLFLFRSALSNLIFAWLRKGCGIAHQPVEFSVKLVTKPCVRPSVCVTLWAAHSSCIQGATGFHFISGTYPLPCLPPDPDRPIRDMRSFVRCRLIRLTRETLATPTFVSESAEFRRDGRTDNGRILRIPISALSHSHR